MFLKKRPSLFIWAVILLIESTKSISGVPTTTESTTTKWPLILSTWEFGFDSAATAWDAAYNRKRSAVDALEEGGTFCELKPCSLSVGFGGNPDESGQPSLDAMIMDGKTHRAAGVANLKRIKNAIGVARKVLDYTKHTLIVGEEATKFAVSMGFKEESLISNKTIALWKTWIQNRCQPNFWMNVIPDPKTSCGPYRPNVTETSNDKGKEIKFEEDNHDTVGIVVVDSKGHLAAGTTTNGLRFKISGRVGDSPIPGSGAYADQNAGAAAATGDGDIMMRFVPSYQTVENMRHGMSPSKAAKDAISRIAKNYPNFQGAVIAADTLGNYGAACNGMQNFTFNVANPAMAKPTKLTIKCLTNGRMFDM